VGVALHLAALTHPGHAPAHEAVTGLPAERAPLGAPARVTLARGGEAVLILDLDPAASALAAQASPEVLHYYRCADATLKPLPPAPPPLRLERGDAYVALSPGARALADSPAIARFLHLRDYFNAQRLAEALLGHLLAPGATPAEDVTVIVVEAR
jgi:hypothetical protein